MTPMELKQANVERFITLIEHEPDQKRRAELDAALARERLRPLDSYPSATSPVAETAWLPRTRPDQSPNR